MLIHWIVVFLVFLVTSIAHELGHMLTLLAFRIPIHRLKFGFGPVIWGKNFKNSVVKRLRIGLFPFGVGAGFDGDHLKFKLLGFWAKIFVFFSGTLLNLIIAVLVSFFVGFGNVIQPSVKPNDIVDISRIFVVLNLMLGIFQLLPFTRFDGGRIFDEIVRRYFSHKSDFFISNLKTTITVVLTSAIFYVYHFWI